MKFTYSESNIIARLIRDPYLIRRYSCLIPNCYTQYDNEADLFGLRKSGYYDEFEIKITRSDFLADKKKYVKYRNWKPREYTTVNHKVPERDWPINMGKQEALVKGHLCNYFYYVVKDDIVSADEICDKFGIIVVKNNGRLMLQREAKLLHKNKMCDKKLTRIYKKLGYRYLDLLKKLNPI